MKLELLTVNEQQGLIIHRLNNLTSYTVGAYCHHTKKVVIKENWGETVFDHLPESIEEYEIAIGGHIGLTYWDFEEGREMGV